ncbi:Basic amino-acid permease [Orbilia oligospora]|uniref:Basic amino-acid permease n=1 Tax=Orbilia oligospora TaxID=2813651 RepID=A0A7C8V992_ORBOL|nr:Basic amino-acid permease [Orbilia oligospora]
MRQTRNIIFLLTLLLLRISFTTAKGGKAKEPNEKVWIFTIKNELRKHSDLGDMHKALEEIDEKPPNGAVFGSYDEKWGTFFMTVNCTEAKKKTIDTRFKHLISASAKYDKYRTPLYTAHEAQYTIDRNINQRQERLMMLQEEGQEPPSNYFYHNSEGEGVTVYFIDTGINRNHPEFAQAELAGRIEVIFSDPLPPDPNDPGRRKIDIDSSLRFSHGSSVAGVVIGQKTGIAARANVVMIAALDKKALSSEALYLSALVKLYRHIVTKNKKNRVILNLSMNAGYFRENNDPIENDIRDGLSIVFDALAEMPNLIITSASGVSEWTQEHVAWSWPNMRAETPQTAKNLVIVGGVDKEGYGIFQKPEPGFQQVYAPAYAVKIASNVGYQLTTGTSFASAYAAGVLANYLSRDPKLEPQEALKMLIQRSYPRVKGGPKVVWLGITMKDAGITYGSRPGPGVICKRDDDKCEKQPPAKTPSKGSPQKDDPKKDDPKKDDTQGGDGGFPTPIDDGGDDDDDDDDDNKSDFGGDDGAGTESVYYVATSTVVEERRYNVYVTVGPNGPSPTKKNSGGEIDPLADPEKNNFRRAEEPAAATHTQPRSPVHPDTVYLALETSTATDKPLSKSQTN